MPDWTYDECPNCGFEDGYRGIYRCKRCDFEGCWDSDGNGCWPDQERCPVCDPDQVGGLGTWYRVGTVHGPEDVASEDDTGEARDEGDED